MEVHGDTCEVWVRDAAAVQAWMQAQCPYESGRWPEWGDRAPVAALGTGARQGLFRTYLGVTDVRCSHEYGHVAVLILMSFCAWGPGKLSQL